MKILKVRISEIKLTEAPDILKTYSLGSCVGLVIYDKRYKRAGMCHIMLPTSRLANTSTESKGKYADIAIPETINLLLQKGSKLRNLEGFLVGGSEMFEVGNEEMKIGKKNIESCKRILEEKNIPIVFEETGGSFGRTVTFAPSSGEMMINSIKKDE